MKNLKTILVSTVILCFLGFIGVAIATQELGLLKKDRIIESGNISPMPSVSMNEVDRVSNLIINYGKQVSYDGSLVIEVKNNTGKLLGTFNYKPWLEKNPTYKLLDNGDVILERVFVGYTQYGKLV